MTKGNNFVFSLIGLIVSVLSILGTVYLTQFAFNSKLGVGDDRTIMMSEIQMNIIRATLVLFWISIAVSFVVSVVFITRS